MSGANISAEQASYDAIRTAVTNLQAYLQGLNAKVKGCLLYTSNGQNQEGDKNQQGNGQQGNGQNPQGDANTNKEQH